MADINQLFGDAKATARSVGADRKQKQLAAAQSAFDNDPSPEKKSALASAFFDNGNYDKALELLNEIVTNHGQNIQVLCDLGFTYKNMDELEKAKETFRKVIELDPKHALARCAESEIWTLDPSYKPSWLKG